MAVNPTSSSTSSVASEQPSFELKATTLTLPIIRLFETDIEKITADLAPKVDQAPLFFRNAPVLIELSSLTEDAGDLELPLLVGLLRGCGMIPFAVRGGAPELHTAAEALDLAVLRESYVRDAKKTGAAPESAASGAPVAQARGGVASPRQANSQFTLVTRPVRSGQRVYAAGGDLSITASVSSGAELMADGNIHVYGPLRGRALAGMNGDERARIFCLGLEAELISIAGNYRVSENIPGELRGVPVQIYLDQNILRIEKL